MTVETEVANLTTAVDNLAEAVNVKKATLDASVADAESARDAAAASATTASGHATSAAASAAAAASTASGIAGFDLDAIAASKAVTAVDVFVYDTSKDSDGGAWRKRTQHTSWYNETLNTATRGSRREFPAVAVIVAEANKVTIYDGDDPALPMWMVFNFNTYNICPSPTSSISALNGIVAISGNNTSSGFAFSGVRLVSFPADTARKHTATNGHSGLYKGNIAQRDDGLFAGVGSEQKIVNEIVNDVAMTVLPDAPIDPATGLPVPTIAVATAGGVSVIKDDGAVVDITHTDSSVSWAVDLYDDGYLGYNIGGFYHRRPIPVSDTQDGVRFTKKDDDVVFMHAQIPIGAYTGQTAYPPRANSSQTFKCLERDVIGFSSGLTHIHQDEASPTEALYALTTSTYNTGWLPGDIKGAFLADTDDTDLVGSGELWNTPTITDPAVWSWDGTTLTGTGDGTSDTATGDAVVAGKVYHVSFTVGAAGSGLFQVRLGSTFIATLGGGANQTYSYTVIATDTTGLRFTDTGSTTAVITNISVKLADADRSVNNNGLVVSGSITRTAVNSGAELVAYSGFSASNYLEQPYNSALDFGTGDFCVMGWVNTTSTASQQNIFFRGDEAASGSYFTLQTLSGYPRIVTVVGGTVATGAVAAINNGNWYFVCGIRRSGTLEMFVNGSLAASISEGSRDLTNTSAIARAGRSVSGNVNQWGGSLALLRISATAPTAQQIARIYQDERPLFQENAACTIAGTSDAVTALAHDSTTNLLHVGSSYGRSVFQGLRRVSNTTTAVGTAISASNGLVVEE